MTVRSTMGSTSGLLAIAMELLVCRIPTRRISIVRFSRPGGGTWLTGAAYKSAIQWIQQQIESDPKYQKDDTRFWVDVTAI